MVLNRTIDITEEPLKNCGSYTAVRRNSTALVVGSSLPRKDSSAPPLLSNYIRVATARPMASTEHVPTDSGPMATI
ncbi:hypothetical protein MHYP_G00154940 [Metynnis hypsauchen]